MVGDDKAIIKISRKNVLRRNSKNWNKMKEKSAVKLFDNYYWYDQMFVFFFMAGP